jgi:EAL domain-containing protein (putative c-di-GMP-specific phosphodiesterase class I)
LAYLQRLPLHRLYIDQSFVQRLPHQGADGVIVKAIIGLAHNLGLQTLAKGVETPEQHQFLQAAGCRLFQGHSIARAQPDFLLPD